MRHLLNIYLIVLGFYLVMIRHSVNMYIYITVLGFYLLIRRPLVNMYFTPCIVVLLMN